MGKIFTKSAEGKEDDIQKVVNYLVDDAIDFVDSEISGARQLSEQYYRGLSRLKHEKGRSGVVVTKVRDTIQGIIPSIARIFTQSDQICEFWSDDEEDEAMTKDQTKFCQNIYDHYGGYECLIGATVDSLKARVGFVKVSLLQEEIKTPTMTQRMLPADATLLAENADISVAGVEETGEELDGQPVANVSYSRIIKRSKWKLDVRPPESFFINSSATCLDDAEIFGFRQILRKYEAVEMGLDKDDIMELPASSDSGQLSTERQTRLGYAVTDSDTTANNPMADEILVCEAWIRMDIDDDGLAEFIYVITAGDNHKIMYMEEVRYHGVAPFYASIEPNNFFPKSMAEDLMQDQDAMTALLRSILDNAALVNSPRTVINENQVNIADAKNNEVGAMIRAKSMGQIEELSTPFVAGQTLPVLQYLEKVSESRSGLTKWSQGIDPDALQSTTKAASLASIQAGDARVEMIARNIGETGVKAMFMAILGTAIHELKQPQSIRVNEQYTEVDPSKWHDKISLNVNVGLGNGNIESKQMILQQISAMQQQLVMQFGLSNPISGYNQMRNNLKHQLYLAGIRNVNDYFPMVDPQTLQQLDQQMQQSKQDQNGQQAAMAQVQAWAQVEREKAQLKLQADMAKLAEQAKADMAKLMQELRIKMETEYLKDDRERDKAAMDYENEAFKNSLDTASRMRVQQEVEKNRGYGREAPQAPAQPQAASGAPVVPRIVGGNEV